MTEETYQKILSEIRNMTDEDYEKMLKEAREMDKDRERQFDANPYNPRHTGTPTEEGWYLCKTKASDFSVHYYDGNKWDFCPLDFVIKWQKIKED